MPTGAQLDVAELGTTALAHSLLSPRRVGVGVVWCLPQLLFVTTGISCPLLAFEGSCKHTVHRQDDTRVHTHRNVFHLKNLCIEPEKAVAAIDA